MGGRGGARECLGVGSRGVVELETPRSEKN